MEEDMPPAGVEMWDSDYTSDDEISTKKELHFRLGEDNLDDTLEYDFSGPALRTGRSAAQKLQIGDSSPESEQEGSQEPEPLGHKN